MAWYFVKHRDITFLPLTESGESQTQLHEELFARTLMRTADILVH